MGACLCRPASEEEGGPAEARLQSEFSYIGGDREDAPLKLARAAASQGTATTSEGKNLVEDPLLDYRGKSAVSENTTDVTVTSLYEGLPQDVHFARSLSVVERSKRNSADEDREGFHLLPLHTSKLSPAVKFAGGSEGVSRCLWLERTQWEHDELVEAVRTKLRPDVDEESLANLTTTERVEVADAIAKCASARVALALAEPADALRLCAKDFAHFGKLREKGENASSIGLRKISETGKARPLFAVAIAGFTDMDSLARGTSSEARDAVSREAWVSMKGSKEGTVNLKGKAWTSLLAMAECIVEHTHPVVDWRSSASELYEQQDYPLWVGSVGREVMCVYQPLRDDNKVSRQCVVACMGPVKADGDVQSKVGEAKLAGRKLFECSYPAKRGNFQIDVDDNRVKLVKKGAGGNKHKSETVASCEGFSEFAIRGDRAKPDQLRTTLKGKASGMLEEITLAFGSETQRDVVLLTCQAFAQESAEKGGIRTATDVVKRIKRGDTLYVESTDTPTNAHKLSTLAAKSYRSFKEKFKGAFVHENELAEDVEEDPENKGVYGLTRSLDAQSFEDADIPDDVFMHTTAVFEVDADEVQSAPHDGGGGGGVYLRTMSNFVGASES